MTRARRRILVLGVTVLAIAAGVVAGMVAGRWTSARNVAQAPATEAGGLAGELGLNPTQVEQMRQIWEAVRNDVRSDFEAADALQRQRDRDLFAMLTDEQKARFQQVSKDYAEKFAELRRRRDQRFQRAVEATRKLLNDEQRRKYDDLLKAHVRPDDLGFAGPGLSDTTTATTPTTVATPTNLPPVTAQQGLPTTAPTR
jgi:hypothetical protein